MTLAKSFADQLGGDPDRALERVRDFRDKVLQGIPADQPIGDRPYDFWRAWFAHEFPSAIPATKSKTGGSNGSARTGARGAEGYDKLTRRAHGQ